MFGGHLSVRSLGDKPISPIYFILFLMVYSLASVAISYYAYFKLKREINDYLDIINNWNAPAIMNIVAANECPENYEQGYANKWSGTSQGCFCKKAFGFSRFYSFSCTWKQSVNGCKTIDSIPAVPLDYWGQINGEKMRICVQRSNETWTNVAPKSGENCTDTSLRKCGTSPEFTFCTVQPQCPINNIKITAFPKNSPLLANCVIENNCLLLDNNDTNSKVIQFQRGDTYDALPSSQMRMNEYGMCKDMEKDNITPDREDFELMEDTRSTCDNEGANMWDRADIMTETQLFLLNNVTSQIKQLDAYGGYYEEGHTGDDYTWGFFSRGYVPWHINCRDKMQDVINLGPDVKDLGDSQLALFIIAIVSGVFLGLIIPYFLLKNLREEWTPFGHSHIGREKMMKAGQIFCYIAKIAQIPFQIITVIFASEIDNFLISIAQYKCSDADTLQTLDELQEDVHETYYSDLLNIGLVITVLLFDTAYFINNRLVRASGYQQLPQNVIEEEEEHIALAHAPAQEPLDVVQTDLRQPVEQEAQEAR